MSQVTYIVGILGSDNSLLYSGTLLVQLTTDHSIGVTTTQAGLLTLKSFDPLLLGAVQGAGSGWTFMGDNDDLSVSTSLILPIDQGSGPAPTRIGGYIALSASGQQEQWLPILGFAAASAEAVPPAHDASLGLSATGAQVPGADSYDYKLTLLDDSFAPAGGGGRIQATGQRVRIGVVGSRYEVSGTLTLDKPSLSVPVSGGGSSLSWTVSGTEGNDSVVLTLVTGRSGADGSLTINGKQFFFVGSPSAA